MRGTSLGQIWGVCSRTGIDQIWQPSDVLTGEKALARNTIRTARERSARNVNPKWQAKPQKSEADFENLCHTFFPPSVRSFSSFVLPSRSLARKYADVIETSLKRIRQRRRRQRQSWGGRTDRRSQCTLSLSPAKECDPLFYSFLSHLRSRSVSMA